jgi:hypothetical protein
VSSAPSRRDRAISIGTPGARRAFRGACLAALLAVAARASAQARCGPAIENGMNPSFQTWSSRAIVFADAFQRTRRFTYWDRGPLSEAPLIPVGSGRLGAGWPDPAQLGAGERYGTMLFIEMEGTIPDGRIEPFVVTWRGAGEVRLEGVFVAGERDRDPNRVEVFVDPTRGTGDELLALSWTATSPSDPVRDVHVWLPGMEHAGLVFWPPFLEKVRATNAGRGPSSWRTLDWTRVNDHGKPASRGGFVFDLAGAITPASPSQGTSRGVAPEYQVALCNELGMNLHFQLPHRTKDMLLVDYVRFVERQLVAIRDGSPGIPGVAGGRPFAGLDPALTVTVELSNEIWNAGFPVNAWMSSEAARKGISFQQQVASQVQLLFDEAEDVFSGPDARRLRKYVGGFVGAPGYLAGVLSHLRPGTHVDALGPAAYLGPRKADIDSWLRGASGSSCPNCPTADELLDDARDKVDVLRPLVRRHRDVARAWTNPDGSHPRLELYEAGLNLKSIGRPWAAAARAVQTDARVFDLLAGRLVPMLVEEDVELVHWYSFMSDQDSLTLDAFGFWNDMDQSLAQPVVRPYSDERAPKASVVCMGPPLASACRTASASRRSAPGNADSFTATPAVVGGTIRASVDLSASGNRSAYVILSLSPASEPLASGHTLLASLDGASFLPLRDGPIATWDLRVPNNPRLMGIQVTLQAVQLDGTSASYTNAMDLVFGR